MLRQALIQSTKINLSLCSTIALLLVGWCVLTTPAGAEPRHLELLLTADSDQSFSDFIQQAEELAGSSVQQLFMTDAAATDVSVSVMGERNGQIAPLLLGIVSRTNWQRNPNIRVWIPQFSNFSMTLLGFTNRPSESGRSASTTAIASTQFMPDPNATPADYLDAHR